MEMRTTFSRIAFWLISAVVLSAALAVTPLKGADAVRETALVNVNADDLKTLEKLPGVTPAVAHKIVNGRPYHNIADLKKATGLSNAKLNTIKDSITFGTEGATPVKKSKSATTSSDTSTRQSSTASSQSPSNPNHKTRAESSGAENNPTPTGRLTPGQTVNINTATAEELDALPGIGPSKAQAIIDFRNQHGPFNSIEDIKNVKGIKEGEFTKLKDYIRVK